MQAWTQSYKTFYIRNLQIFIISYNVCFQPNLIFVGKTGAYSRVKHLDGVDPLG
jgi:hypothetical protein